MVELKLFENHNLNKYALIITVGFFLIVTYLTFVHHNFWYEFDGILPLYAGEQILAGDGENVKMVDAPVGGTVFFAILNLIFNDGFFTYKIISIIFGTGIIFVSYYIIKNIFNAKIAIISQLFTAVYFHSILLSTRIVYDIVPTFMIFVSFYFLTKNEIKLLHIIIIGALLGTAALFRYQAILIVFGVIVFLLIRDKNIQKNLFYILVIATVFFISFSPLIIYNYVTHEVFLDSNTNFSYYMGAEYQIPESQAKLLELIISDGPSGMFIDIGLLLKNYFYNLFFVGPNILFNFNTVDNLSILPPISFIGIIPVFGGLLYLLKIKPNKKNLLIITSTSIFTTLMIALIGDIQIHFFAIFLIPIFSLCILNFKNVEKKFLPMLIISIIFFITISIAHLGRGFQLYPMWISIVTLSTLFFIKVLPEIYYKLRSKEIKL